MRKMHFRPPQSGVTLLELMVVVIVVAVLASIAVSSYRSYLLRTNRTEAKLALLRVQAAQEKFFLQNSRYATNAELTTGLGVLSTTPGGMYTIALAAGLPTTQYLATATAQAGQLADNAACQQLRVNELGVRTPDDSNNCWR